MEKDTKKTIILAAVLFVVIGLAVAAMVRRVAAPPRNVPKAAQEWESLSIDRQIEQMRTEWKAAGNSEESIEMEARRMREVAEAQKPLK